MDIPTAIGHFTIVLNVKCPKKFNFIESTDFRVADFLSLSFKEKQTRPNHFSLSLITILSECSL